MQGGKIHLKNKRADPNNCAGRQKSVIEINVQTWIIVQVCTKSCKRNKRADLNNCAGWTKWLNWIKVQTRINVQGALLWESYQKQSSFIGPALSHTSFILRFQATFFSTEGEEKLCMSSLYSRPYDESSFLPPPQKKPKSDVAYFVFMCTGIKCVCAMHVSTTKHDSISLLCSFHLLLLRRRVILMRAHKAANMHLLFL